MTRDTDTGSEAGRRTFLKSVGAAGTAAALSGRAAADSRPEIDDRLDPSGNRPQEALVVFADREAATRLEEAGLAL